MDVSKFVKKAQTSNHRIVTIYLKEKDIEAFDILKKYNINMSMVCRHAIRETAKKVKEKI